MGGGSGRAGISLLVGEPLDVEGYPQVPSGLDLEQVHLYVRHGERTPVRTRMADPPASIPEHWQMCSMARRFREAVNSATTTLSEPGSEGVWFKRGTEMQDGSTVANLCLLGDLTDIGKESTYNFGVALRKLYVDKLGFLPGTLQNEKQAYFRSTNVPRTIESLEHIVHGLYPQTHCASGVIPSILVRCVVRRDGIEIMTRLHRNKVDENIVGNILSCPQLGLLELRFAEGMSDVPNEWRALMLCIIAAAARWNSRLQTLDKRLSKYIKGKPIRVDGSPRASGILDTVSPRKALTSWFLNIRLHTQVRSAAAHGLKVPDDFWDPKVIDLIVCSQLSKFNGSLSMLMVDFQESAVSDEWFTIKTERGRRLGMGRLLADVSTKMQTKIEQGNKDPLKILVHSTHDSTLAALCSTFDVFDDRWPPFTSSVTFELFKKKNSGQGSSLQSLLSGLWSAHSKEEHYVRMRYKNKNLVLPMCAKEGDHLAGSPEFCTLIHHLRRLPGLGKSSTSSRLVNANADADNDGQHPQVSALRLSVYHGLFSPAQTIGHDGHGKTCKKHTPHKVTQYKKGKDSLFAQGKRRYDRKQSGYGGQTKPVFHKKAKTTKKVVLRLECTVCKYKMQLSLKRCKHFELGGEKKTKGAALQFTGGFSYDTVVELCMITSDPAPVPAPTPSPPPPQPVEKDAARVRKEWSKFINAWYEPRKKKLVEKLQKDLVVKYKNLGSIKETRILREMEFFEKLDSIAQQLAQPARAEWERRLELAQLREDQWDDMSGEEQQAVMTVFVGFFADDVEDMMDDDILVDPSSIEDVWNVVEPQHREMMRVDEPLGPKLPSYIPPTSTRGDFEFFNPTSFTDSMTVLYPKNLPTLSMDHLAILGPSNAECSTEPPSRPQDDRKELSSSRASQAPAVDDSLPVMGHGKESRPFHPIIPGNACHTGSEAHGSPLGQPTPSPWCIDIIRSSFPRDLTGYVKQEGKHPVASGGYGDIYRGTFLLQGRQIDVAIKTNRTYASENADSSKKMKQLRREMRVWLNLDHANVLPLFGTTMDFGLFPAMVCPWVENGALTSYLERLHNTLTRLQRLVLLNGVACGLLYLHSKHIVHGDLSGANVLIHKDGRACIADFGLSTLLTELGASTFATSHHAKGSLRWMAPELIMVSEDDSEDIPPKVTPQVQSDVYSFGGILTGNVPYHYYVRDAQVMNALGKGITPRRPKPSLMPLNPDHLGEEIVEWTQKELSGVFYGLLTSFEVQVDLDIVPRSFGSRGLSGEGVLEFAILSR
ncbi:hypothetical protein J3R83DRAFT_10398 [Lanmaoa asiatica]|nr:hypothetical protein J3R83DRAFT_10398 [Lanmaoa asiatica]